MAYQLEIQDQRYLRAAEGWLELGDWREANEELERITPRLRAHPDVLFLRVRIYAKADRWDLVVALASGMAVTLPDNPLVWIHQAIALHKLNRTKEAQALLASVIGRFPADVEMHYLLACYTCQEGDLPAAAQWLKQAIGLERNNEIRLRALDDKALEPLWQNIGKQW